jgi:hypothetical protein
MAQNFDEKPAVIRNWLEKARLAPTLAEAAFYNRKARLTDEHSRNEPCGTACDARITSGRGRHQQFH